MKKFKKMFAVMLSLAMVLGMSLTAFADGEPTAPSGNDTATVTIKGIVDTDGVTISAYKIVEPNYGSSGLTGYTLVQGYDMNNKTDFKPTVAEIATIATYARENGTPEDVSFSKNAEGNYTARLGAGEYLILVESTNYTYNPMVVSVAYANANNAATLANGMVDASTDWDLIGEGTFAKSSPVTPTKKATQSTQNTGEYVNYTIEGTIPSYSAEYTDPVYTITDTFTNLEYDSTEFDLHVTIGGSEVTEGEDTYTFTAPTAERRNTFTIAFNDIGKRAGDTANQRKVVITYKLKVSDSASVVNPSTNEAKLTYSNHPGSTDDSKKPTTYTYTFNIENMFKKVGKDEHANGLAGATFGLFKVGADGTVATTAFKSYTTTADDNYAIHFEGLAEGKYEMKETAAPSDYTISDKVYVIEIKDVVYDKPGADDKKVTGYSVVVGEKGSADTPKTYIYTIQDGVATRTAESSNAITEVQNTKLSSLPSTGGIGTTIFTIGGCAIMIIAAGLFFASRRKSAK